MNQCHITLLQPSNGADIDRDGFLSMEDLSTVCGVGEGRAKNVTTAGLNRDDIFDMIWQADECR